jgi:hypothetical protein
VRLRTARTRQRLAPQGKLLQDPGFAGRGDANAPGGSTAVVSAGKRPDPTCRTWLPHLGEDECEDRSASACAAEGGVDKGVGVCAPDTCADVSPNETSSAACRSSPAPSSSVRTAPRSSVRRAVGSTWVRAIATRIRAPTDLRGRRAGARRGPNAAGVTKIGRGRDARAVNRCCRRPRSRQDRCRSGRRWHRRSN